MLFNIAHGTRGPGYLGFPERKNDWKPHPESMPLGPLAAGGSVAPIRSRKKPAEFRRWLCGPEFSQAGTLSANHSQRQWNSSEPADYGESQSRSFALIVVQARGKQQTNANPQHHTGPGDKNDVRNSNLRLNHVVPPSPHMKGR
jgi:hypothetical protein